MKYEALIFSLKNNEKVFMNVVCCCRDWDFKGSSIIKFLLFFRALDKHQLLFGDSFSLFFFFDVQGIFLIYFLIYLFF